MQASHVIASCTQVYYGYPGVSSQQTSVEGVYGDNTLELKNACWSNESGKAIVIIDKKITTVLIRGSSTIACDIVFTDTFPSRQIFRCVRCEETVLFTGNVVHGILSSYRLKPVESCCSLQ